MAEFWVLPWHPKGCWISFLGQSLWRLYSLLYWHGSVWLCSMSWLICHLGAYAHSPPCPLGPYVYGFLCSGLVLRVVHILSSVFSEVGSLCFLSLPRSFGSSKGSKVFLGPQAHGPSSFLWPTHVAHFIPQVM